MKCLHLFALAAVVTRLHCTSIVDADGDDVITNPFSILTGRAVVHSFTGASGLKVVFVNVTVRNRTLCLVDFTLDTPRAVEYLDDTNVFMPVISPDGRYVAYCTNNEGQSGPSKIYLRTLETPTSSPTALDSSPAYIPRWWVHPATGDTCIVFTNSALYNESATWLSTRTYRQKMQGGKPAGPVDLLAGDGSYHDGLSRDGDYLVTGFSRLLVKDLKSGNVRQLFTYPGNGKDSLGSTQVCNVSISPDTGADVQCLFLDFGCTKVSAITGSPYGIHQYLFVTKLTDTVTRTIKSPDGEQAWENSEWSNHPDFAIACVRNSAGKSHAIYLVNLQEGKHLEVLSGTELQHPALWIE